MEPETTINEENKKFSRLRVVTPLSKYIAMILFIALPFIGGWIGYTHAPEKVVEVERIVVQEIPVPDKNGSEISKNPPEWRTYTNEQLEFEIDYPSHWFIVHESQDPYRLQISDTPANQFVYGLGIPPRGGKSIMISEGMSPICEDKIASDYSTVYEVGLLPFEKFLCDEKLTLMMQYTDHSATPISEDEVKKTRELLLEIVDTLRVHSGLDFWVDFPVTYLDPSIGPGGADDLAFPVNRIPWGSVAGTIKGISEENGTLYIGFDDEKFYTQGGSCSGLNGYCRINENEKVVKLELAKDARLTKTIGSGPDNPCENLTNVGDPDITKDALGVETVCSGTITPKTTFAWHQNYWLVISDKGTVQHILEQYVP